MIINSNKWQRFVCYFLIIPGILAFSESEMNPEKVTSSSIDAIKYLHSFGWLDTIGVENDAQTLNSKEVITALKKFQAFAGIRQSGRLDRPTLRVMTLPRCGETDTDTIDDEVEIVDGGKVLRRQKRFVIQGTRWRPRELKYNISKYTSDLPKDDVDKIIASAFRQWENVANISFFRATYGKIHLDVRFEKRFHGDHETFDGPGGTTAHAYFPAYGGAVHFDDDENWTHNSEWGVNLFQVATHEIGHALGLEHSNVPDSVMSPFYRTFRTDFKLYPDDIEAIQTLYGKRVLTICDEAKVDAATTMIDKNTYIFTGTYVYLITPQSEMTLDSPTAISVAFPGLPNNLDAAITRANGISYFFQGDEFWRVTNMSVDTGFPKQVSEYFPGIPTPIDAAFVFSQDENIYFFKGSEFRTYDHRLNPPVSDPQPIYKWRGIPEEGLDAAVSLSDAYGNHFTYFFKNDMFWKYNDKSRSIFLSDPPFPKKVSTYLFGCRM